MRYLLLVSLLVGCAGPRPTWKVDCVYIEVPVDLIEAGHNIRYSNMENSVKLAKGLFDGRYGEGEFCKRAEDLTVKMMPKSWDCIGSPTGCAGEYISTDARIKVIAGWALLHEFIHAQESYLFMPGTFWHEGWKDNGQYLLADQYENVTVPWWD